LNSNKYHGSIKFRNQNLAMNEKSNRYQSLISKSELNVIPNFEVHLLTNFVNKLKHLVELKMISVDATQIECNLSSTWDITWPGT